MDQALDTARYDLFTLDAAARLIWKNTDRGVAIEPTALVLWRAGRWRKLRYDEIDTITLSTGVIGASRTIGQCTLTLRTGRRIVITNTNAAGTADGMRDELYREFIRDFHRALIVSGAAGYIVFRSGFSRGRMTGLMVALVAAAGVFVLLPLMLLLITRNLQALWLLLAGATIVAPAAGIAHSNKAAAYAPQQPPDLLP